jgi:eukaryotic translation initiation factor 2C
LVDAFQVRSYEIAKIQEACKALNENYQPKITFAVVQKRHHTRFVHLSSVFFVGTRTS